MRTLPLLLLCLMLAPPGSAAPPPGETLKVVATLPTYGELAREIGGDLVDVVVLCRPGQDIHAVTATPSLMARIRGADLLLFTGLDAELWLDGLLRGSGNTHLTAGSPGAIDMSAGVATKEVPAVLSRSQGDIHAYGNPHIWTDPLLVRGMAAKVRDALAAALPEQADAIAARYEQFHQRFTRRLIRWLTDYRGLKGQRVVVYHRSWIYFLDRFGLVRAGTVEPKPRVAPTAAHLSHLVEDMKESGVRVILREPWQHPEATDYLEEHTGAVTLELATFPGFPEQITDILDHFEHNLAALAEALGVEVPSHP